MGNTNSQTHTNTNSYHNSPVHKSPTHGHSKSSNTQDAQNLTKQRDYLLKELNQICPENDFPASVINQSILSSFEDFLNLLSNPSKSNEVTNMLVSLIWHDQSYVSREKVTEILKGCCSFQLKEALLTHSMNENMLDMSCYNSLTKSIGISQAKEIDQEQFKQWIKIYFPTLFDGIVLWLRKHVKPHSQTIDQFPPEASASTTAIMQLKSILTPSWIWYMVHNLPIIYLTADAKCSTVNERIASILHGQMWDHLYDSLRDGASLNRFQHHIFGYKSPLIMLFEISDGYVFCLCCDEDFKESPKHFGGVHSRLIQLKPVLKILQEGPNIIFMNTKLRGVSSLGLHIGRDLQHTFLTIDGDFFNATHINGEGRLSAIEVWGCGGTKAAQEQGNMRQWEAKQIEKLRKVKNDYATEEVILNLGGVQTRHGYDQNPN